MRALPTLLIAALLLLLGAAWWWGRGAPSTSSAPVPAPPSGEERAPAPVDLAAPGHPSRAGERMEPRAPAGEGTAPAAPSTPARGVIHGVVLDASARPVPDACVHVNAGAIGVRKREWVRVPASGPADAVTDGRGEFSVPPQAEGWTLALVTAPGHAPRLATLCRNAEEAPSERIEIVLAASARAFGVVDGATPGLEARAVSNAYALQSEADRAAGFLFHDVVNAAPVGPDGRFELPDLPTGVRLRFELVRASKEEVVVREPEPVQLAAGDAHVLAWTVGSGGRLRCLVREVDGRPAPGIGVRLVSRDVGRPGRSERYWQPTAEGRTDATGALLLGPVQPGRWIVALAPSDDDYAAVARVVEVPTAGETATVELTLHRELAVEGTLLGPDGEPAAGYVSARSPEYSVRETVGRDGSFRLTPLPPGEYTVTADGARVEEGGFAPSEPVTVAAGTSDVVVRLRPAGRLSLRAVDAATEEGVDAAFTVARANERFGWVRTGEARAARDFEQLLTGEYVVLATSTDGRAGLVEGLQLDANESLALDVPLHEAGRVRVRYTGAHPYLQIGARIGDTGIGGDTAIAGGETTLDLPPGRYTIELTIYDHDSLARPVPRLFEERREVVVVAGEEALLDVRP